MAVINITIPDCEGCCAACDDVASIDVTFSGVGFFSENCTIFPGSDPESYFKETGNDIDGLIAFTQDAPGVFLWTATLTGGFQYDTYPTSGCDTPNGSGTQDVILTLTCEDGVYSIQANAGDIYIMFDGSGELGAVINNANPPGGTAVVSL